MASSPGLRLSAALPGTLHRQHTAFGGRVSSTLFLSVRRFKSCVYSPKAPDPVGPYSQAIKAKGFVFVSGQIGVDPSSMRLVEGGIKAQTKQCLTNVEKVLQAAGCDWGSVVSTTVLLSDMAHFRSLNEVYSDFFKKPAQHNASRKDTSRDIAFPSRAAFAVKELPMGALVEITAVAVTADSE
ncbi:endoribonuclease l-psp [Cystoisospora suis]|uniref:Endoribonuclease l-psp n=1 Tax=Cystoisospora suis TaxID=483139 RepID=A0A2C6L6T5_9APIC|nr:endoribonuclease l-psp [Cystoisospora suis]